MERRLAAIVAADVVGYSRLMGADEAATLAALRTHRRELIDPKIAEHQGRIVKLMGDGMLLEFPSIVAAVACSAEIQRGMDERNLNVPPDRCIAFRVGVNLGDVIVEGADIFGDGVNVAARLEAIAPPRGIAISAAARDLVGDRLELTFEDIGEQTLKNIAWPIRVYLVGWTGRPGAAIPRTARAPLALPNKPSIAVMPFANMSGDPEQEYFADGLVEDIITNLSKNHGLFVIARNSTFAYKGKSVDIRQVARELGVRYVLEGSVRRAANRLRITGQLIEGTAGTHVWADKFEGAVEDIFDLQDRLTVDILGAIEPSLRRAEIDRALRKHPGRLDAYDLFLRALPHAIANTPADGEKALRLLDESLRLDPDYAIAHGYAAWCREQRFLRAGFRPEDRAAAIGHSTMALRAGQDDPQALALGGFIRATILHDFEGALSALDRSLALNPNLALAYGFSATVCSICDRHDRATAHALRALRLSPFDPMNYHAHFALSLVGFLAGRFAEAAADATLAIRANPGFSLLHVPLVASEAELDRMQPARAAAQRLLEAAPEFTVGGFLQMDVLAPADAAALAQGMRKAGLPE